MIELGIWRNKEWLQEQYDSGKSWNDIGKIVGRTGNAVRIAAKGFGITSRSISEARDLINNIDLPIIVNMYNENMSTSDIASQYGVASSVMRSKLIKAGVIFRSGSDGIQIKRDSRNGCDDRDVWDNKEWLEDKYSLLSISEISELVGWSYTYVHNSMVKHGVQIRNRAGGKKLAFVAYG